MLKVHFSLESSYETTREDSALGGGVLAVFEDISGRYVRGAL